MAGFLDKNSRVIDMVLTSRGKELLSKGELQFVYWAAFDDEVDYDPYIANSGSLTEDELLERKLQAVEDTLVREATTGYNGVNRSALDHTNVFRPLFDMPQGQTMLPELSSSAPSTVNVEVRQQKVLESLVRWDENGKVVETIGPHDRGYLRTASSVTYLDYTYKPGSFPPDAKLEGFLVRVFESGSEGWVEVDEKLDTKNNLTYNNDLQLVSQDPERA